MCIRDRSTFLKCINRMNDLVDNVRIEGSIEIEGEKMCIRDRAIISVGCNERQL